MAQSIIMMKSKKNDFITQSDLEKLGYTILRFTNDQVSKQSETVLNKISEIVNVIINNKTSKNGV